MDRNYGIPHSETDSELLHLAERRSRGASGTFPGLSALERHVRGFERRDSWNFSNAPTTEAPPSEVNSTSKQQEAISFGTSRLLVVANRLPMSISGSGGLESRFTLKRSSGGLVSALQAMKKSIPYIWIGWPGLEVEKSDHQNELAQLLKKEDCEPVFLDAKTQNNFYNSMANNTLWPLFHYMPLPMDASASSFFDLDAWKDYVKANHIFAEKILEIYKPGDLVWVHDYHLLLVPSILRKARPDMIIGFFLHTPWPSSEIFRMLPVRKEILKGVLGANLIGFHAFPYLRHFSSSCSRILGADLREGGSIAHDSGFSVVGTFPIGIDPLQFETALKSDPVQQRIKELQERYKGKRLLLGIDRLDHIKGVPHKLLGFEAFLKSHPEFKDKVVLVQVGVPTRGEVAEYQKLSSQCNEIVGRINSIYGSISHIPITYINQSVSSELLTALYHLADVAIITSLRDGMNLVSFEYVASQVNRDPPGVLLLSEFAGAAACLPGARLFNPWDTHEVSEAIFEALTASPHVKQANMNQMRLVVNRHTSAFWGRSFITELQIQSRRTEQIQSRLPSKLPLSVASNAFKHSGNRLIVLDWDGTLIPLRKIHSAAHPNSETIDLLKRLSSDPSNTVVIITGRNRETMDKWLSEVPNVLVVAEFGARLRVPTQPMITDNALQASGGLTARVTAAAKLLAASLPPSDSPRNAKAVQQQQVVTETSPKEDNELGSNEDASKLQVDVQASSSRRSELRSSPSPSPVPSPSSSATAASPPGSEKESKPWASLYLHHLAAGRRDSFGSLTPGQSPLASPSPHAASSPRQLSPSLLSGTQPLIASGPSPPPSQSPSESSSSSSSPQKLSSTPLSSLSELALSDDSASSKQSSGSAPPVPETQWLPLVPVPSGAIRPSLRHALDQVLESFTERTPGSMIEKKEFSTTWHFRNADADFGSWQARELQVHLSEVFANEPIRVLTGSKGALEIVPLGLSKGKALRRILRHLSQFEAPAFDCVFVFGDDGTDEEMFRLVRKATSSVAQLQQDYAEETSLKRSQAAGSTPTIPVEEDWNSDTDEELEVAGQEIHAPVYVEMLPKKEEDVIQPRVQLEEQHWEESSIEGSTKAHFAPEKSPEPSKPSTVQRVLTVTVGRKISRAKYYLESCDDITFLLRALANRVVS